MPRRWKTVLVNTATPCLFAGLLILFNDPWNAFGGFLAEGGLGLLLWTAVIDGVLADRRHGK